jgi:hypothetical protein
MYVKLTYKATQRFPDAILQVPPAFRREIEWASDEKCDAHRCANV